MVVGRSPHALTHVHKQAGVRLYDHLGLESVRLLLTTVVPSLLLRVRRALHSLFKGVDQGSQLGHLCKHLFQGATVLATRVNLTHLVSTGLGEEGHEAMHHPRHTGGCLPPNSGTNTGTNAGTNSDRTTHHQRR